ncbi:hypothetical protein GCK72_021363 [Caenorhabditis remanei]|uniref:F-box domain-containing protein n=1 Tax=Caenorhabditis remanei TaxID=31234 RepID=A0A6A5GKD8_CAERE|nr:hypothetical protein GCK72_021363 [Caenorhabditis remanei]KAF1754799.1 hypothetical protein GCK72_021363 [Caenorhabditis remanei]
MTSEVSLLQMPDVALNEIVKKCDYQSIQSLRKVCRDLRNFIKDVKPDYQFTNVSIELDSCFLDLTFNESDDEGNEITIRYRKHGLNCYVSLTKPNGKNSKHLLNTNFIDCFSTDFAIAMSSQKSIIQQFTLSHPVDFYMKSRAGDLLKKLKSENLLLKVRNVVLSTNGTSMIARFLQILDPNYLETIKIGGRTNQMTSTEMNQICKLEQFKKAKELEISTYYITTSVEYFSHFENVTLCYISVTDEMFRSLKQMFITSPNLSSFSIQFLSYCDRDLICCFGPRDKQLSTHDTDKWVLMIPGSDDVIVVEMKLSRVQFERKKNN